MNYILVLIMLLSCFPRMVQSAPSPEIPKELFPSGSEVLVGSIVRYDASMSSHTSQADFVLKLKKGSENKYIRLRYAPNGFGFDAPPATDAQLLPKEMFSNGQLVWTFQVHAPRNREEESACMSRRRQYAPGKKGHLVEMERFQPVPGNESDKTPQSESLSCLVVESWAKKQ